MPVLAAALALIALHAGAQGGDPEPLPDINALMRQVEANERASESVQQNYIYRVSNQLHDLDSHGSVKKTETRDFEVFWINGVQLRRTLRINGKELSQSEKDKDNARIDKEIAKARERREKGDKEGKPTDSQGHEELTFSRMLELGSFSNPRRVLVGGRPTILVDYTGNPDAKSHSAAEGLFKELSGTVAVDEQDHAIQHLEGRFAHDFKLMGGLAINIKAGTSFSATFTHINGEVWLPREIEGHGHARYLVFFNLNGDFQSTVSDYRKFKATATILPGVTTVDPSATSDPPPR